MEDWLRPGRSYRRQFRNIGVANPLSLQVLGFHCLIALKRMHPKVRLTPIRKAMLLSQD